MAAEQPAGTFTISEALASGQQKALTLPAGLFPMASFSPEVNRLIFASNSALQTFYQTTQSGYDLRPPTDALKQKLEVFREFTGEDGKPISQVKLGDEVEVLETRDASDGPVR